MTRDLARKATLISEIATPALTITRDPPAVARDFVSRWLNIDATLSPIIGRGGVAALYRRSLHVSGRNYRWISPIGDGQDLKMDLTVLERDLERQPGDVAARAAAEFLATFHDLVTGLIGPSLSERLLGASTSASQGAPQTKDLPA
ncbi:MAG: hypothetical protein ABI672_16895 [Vicinamibacteria bacterium]